MSLEYYCTITAACTGREGRYIKVMDASFHFQKADLFFLTFSIDTICHSHRMLFLKALLSQSFVGIVPFVLCYFSPQKDKSALTFLVL